MTYVSCAREGTGFFPAHDGRPADGASSERVSNSIAGYRSARGASSDSRVRGPDPWCNLGPKGGTSADYLSRRIARDAPAVLERMKAGEFPSVRAAAIEAGIVKTPTLVDQAVRLYERAWPNSGDPS